MVYLLSLWSLSPGLLSSPWLLGLSLRLPVLLLLTVFGLVLDLTALVRLPTLA